MRALIRRLALPLACFTFGIAPAYGQASEIRVNEVHPGEKWVELTNAGNQTVDVSNLLLCNFPAYASIVSLTVLSGSTNLEPGAFVVVSWASLGSTSAEVGLYAAGTGNFADPSRMYDYMEYGTSGHTREPVAVTNSFWEAGTTVALPESGQSLSRVDAGFFGSSNWAATVPTQGAPNQFSTAVEEPGEPVRSFRLSDAYPNPFNPRTTFSLQVEHAQRVRVEVYNQLGQRVRALFDGFLPAQQARAFVFDAADLPSGLYLYRAQGEAFTASRPVILLK